MGAVWQVQEAKNRFSEMIEQALAHGPQVITRHGREVARLVPAGHVAEVTLSMDASDGFTHYLLSAPKADGLALPVRRSRKSNVTLGD